MRRATDSLEENTHRRLSALRQLPGYSVLTAAGREYVDRAVRSPPAREVGRNSLLSGSGALVLQKFPDAVAYESTGAEKPYVQLAAIDPEVVDLLAQPPPLKVMRLDKRGRRAPRDYTPDYIEFRKDRFCFVEVKCEADLRELALQSTDWQEDSSGTWHFQPGDHEAQRLGMSFRVFNADSLGKPLIANLDFLCRLTLDPLTDRETRLTKKMVDELMDRPQTIRELCSRVSGLNGSIILRAILSGKAFGRLRTQLIGTDFVVYGEPKDILGSDQKSARNSPQSFTPGPLQRRLDVASVREIEGALAAEKRYDDRRTAGERMNATDYRNKKSLQIAESEGACRIAAFLPNYRDRGGPGPATTKETREAIIVHAKRYLASPRPNMQSKIYADFKLYAKEIGLEPPSQETHRCILRKGLSDENAALLTAGKRGFHAARPRTDGAEMNARLGISGLHVHIDGVQADVRAAAGPDGDYARLIFYPMVDDHSGYVLGVGVKIGGASTLAVMMALRDCIDRHGTLPACIHHDWGSEFVNHHVEQSLAQLGVSLSRRPSAAPRFGGRGESFNSQLSSFLENLPGSTHPDKAGRSADGAKKSRATAALSIEEIVEKATHWIFEIWNRNPGGANRRTPEAEWMESVNQFPEAVIRCPSTISTRYCTSLPFKNIRVDARKGVSIQGTRFTSTSLPDVIRSGDRPTDVRLDCKNPSIAYVNTRRGPLELRSSNFHRVNGATVEQRVRMTDDLLTSRSRAKRNQENRNTAEARLLRLPVQANEKHLERIVEGDSDFTPLKEQRRLFLDAVAMPSTPPRLLK